MTEQTDAAEVARAMTEAVMYLGDWETQTSEEIGAELAHVLSDWLAAREAAARAEGARAVVEAVESLLDEAEIGWTLPRDVTFSLRQVARNAARTDGAGS
jgi:hypothetical protein